MDVSKRDAYLSDLRCTLDELRKRVRSGGKDLQHAMAVAYAGVAAATRGEVVKQEQWEAVQRVLCGVLPDYVGKDVKARLACKERMTHVIWQMVLDAQVHLQEWRNKAVIGTSWLKAREEGRGWLMLVLRAWREETERSGGRGGGAMNARACVVRWPAHRQPTISRHSAESASQDRNFQADSTKICFRAFRRPRRQRKPSGASGR